MTASINDLLETWYRRLREAQFSHYEAAKAFELMNYWLGIPSIVLSTVLGTSIFATLGESVNTNIQILFGLVSVLAAILTGLQTFLKFSERAEKHRAIAARYGSLRREIEELAYLGQGITKEMITPLRESIDRLAEEAPNIPERIWAKTKKTLGNNNTNLLSRNKPSNQV
ncbi:MAG: SLATT domain-containing protein [Cyanobium sp.]